jgi:glycosyltransferase involved in cell wall biosynthesis
VLGCRNEAEHLPQALTALAEQAVDGWVQTVLVDDGSTDDTAAVAESFADRLPGLEVVGTPHRGRAGALNAGIAAVTADAVVFVDGDDEVAPGYLAAMQVALAEHPFVAARLDHDTLNPPPRHGSRPPEQTTGLCYEPQRPWPVAGGGTLGVRRQELAEVGGYDAALMYAQDSDLCWRLALHGVPLVWVPDAVLRYRHRATTRATFEQARRYGRGGVLLDHRYGSRRSALTVLKRSIRLQLLVRRVPFLGSDRVRFATAFEAGLCFGWLEGTLAPGRFFTEEALRRQAPLRGHDP